MDNNLIRFELTKDKKLIRKLASNPRVHWKIYGTPYRPGEYIHIAYQNYLAIYKNKILGLLQVDRFTDKACFIHGFVLPQYCKPIVFKVGGPLILELFETFSNFNKIIAPTPATAKHAIRWLKNLGFKVESILKDATTYRDEETDLLLLTYEFNR